MRTLGSVVVMLLACTPPPTLRAVAPAVGPTTGGTQVVVNGTALSKTDTISFGGTPATLLVELAASALLVTTPAHAAGTVDVTLTTEGGFTTSLPQSFTFVKASGALTLTSVSPESGSTAGGTPVALTGTGFVSGDAVLFGGVMATSVVVDSLTTLAATTPAHPLGMADVIVADPSGNTTTLPGAFEFTAP